MSHTEARRDGGTEFSLGSHAVGPTKSAPSLRAPCLRVNRQALRRTSSSRIPPDILARAGIETAAARRGESTAGLRLPATVQPNAYRQVAVLSTSAGRVLSVFVELGQRVAKGDPLVQTAQPGSRRRRTRSTSAPQADLALARQQIARLERLVTIGAASQQELDAARAQQTRLAADVEGARARLLLLGRTAPQVAALSGPGAIDPTVTIVAPMAGTDRPHAPPIRDRRSKRPRRSSPIVDLDTVWIVGDAYERDLASVGVGTPVTITSAALPGQSFAGRVRTSIRRSRPDSRTARVRVEIANPGGRLRLGMLMEMRVNTASGARSS